MQPLRPLTQSDEMQEGIATSHGPSLDTPDRFAAQTPFPPAPEPAHGPRAASTQPSSQPPLTSLPATPPISASSAGGETPALPGTVRSARPVVVIRGERKRPRTKPGADGSDKNTGRHLRPRARLVVLLAALLIILGATLFTLVPLSAGQNSVPILSGLSMLIHDPQGSVQIEAQQTATAVAVIQVHASTLNISRSQYVAIAQQDATSAGISPTYFVRQIQLESGFNPNAASPSGAVGIAQFMPSTAAGLGIDPWNPIQALQGAARMMANLYHQYGDYAKALAAYNAGSANLNYAVSSCGSGWLSCMPAETQHYVATIMG